MIFQVEAGLESCLMLVGPQCYLEQLDRNNLRSNSRVSLDLPYHMLEIKRVSHLAAFQYQFLLQA